MKKTKYYRSTAILMLFLFKFGVLPAQQLTPFTLYRDHWSLINPAALSNNYLLTEYPQTVSVSHRSQYLGLGNAFREAPNTQVMSLEWINEPLNSTFGAHLVSDRTGLVGNAGASLQYAYRLRLSRRTERFVSVGISAGLMNYFSRIHGSDFPEPDPDIFPVSTWATEVNAGIFFQEKDDYYFGISFPQLFAQRLNIGENSNSPFNLLNRPRHIYGVAGMYIPFDFFGLGDETALLDISAWLRYIPGSLPILDGNIRYQHNQTFWVGSGVSSNGVSHFEAGFLAGKTIGLFDDQIKLSLAYDMPFLTRIAYFGSAFEISLGFSWY